MLGKAFESLTISRATAEPSTKTTWVVASTVSTESTVSAVWVAESA